MMIGYACISAGAGPKGLESQIARLRAFGASEVIDECLAPGQRREKLETALSRLQRGDRLVMTGLGCAVETMAELDALLATLGTRRAGLVVLSLDGRTHDASNAAERMILRALAPLDGVACLNGHTTAEPARARPKGPKGPQPAAASQGKPRPLLGWHHEGRRGLLRAVWRFFP